MKIGIIGSGGREHALCCAIKKSNKIRIDKSKIFTKALWSRKNKFDITGKKKEQ